MNENVSATSITILFFGEEVELNVIRPKLSHWSTCMIGKPPRPGDDRPV